jgi:cell shape-determining protein MreC
MTMASMSKNEELQNNYLKVILEEVRSLRAEVKKLESEVKDLKKQLTVHNQNHHSHSPVV